MSTVPDHSRASSYLQETAFCDVTNEDIARLASRLGSDCRSASSYAVACFYQVRDQIEYTAGIHPHKASDTLNAGYGSCSNKANLFVALLRAKGIPAGFYVMRVDARLFFGPVCPPRITQHMGAHSVHIYAGATLRQQWIRCDKSVDLPLCRSSAHLNSPSIPVEFNGVTDARLRIVPEHIHSDSGEPLASIDEFLRKKPKIATVIPATFNAFIHFARIEASPTHTVEQFHAAFFSWFEKARPSLYHDFLEFEEIQTQRRHHAPV